MESQIVVSHHVDAGYLSSPLSTTSSGTVKKTKAPLIAGVLRMPVQEDSTKLRVKNFEISFVHNPNVSGITIFLPTPNFLSLKIYFLLSYEKSMKRVLPGQLIKNFAFYS